MQPPVISIKKNTNTVTASTAGELDLFADNDGLKTVDESGNITSVGGTTNLSNTPSATQVVIESSSGSDTTLAAAISSLAGVMSAADKTKLDGIQSGAEANVNADWNALSGDAQILNKPNLGVLALLDQVDTAQIVNHAVTNQELATMNANTVKGRLSGNGTAQDVAMSSLPISTATQTALDLKLEASDIANKVSSDTTGVTGADQITNMFSLTQAEYDLITPDSETFYLIVG